MARRSNELNFLQNMSTPAEGTNHRLTPQFVPCFVPFRPQTRTNPQNLPPKRRLEIAIEVKPGAELPSPVEIIHTAQD